MQSKELPILPPRQLDAHKGMFGHALLMGGSVGMAGAISIAGMACMAAGAGRVTLGIPQVNYSIVASYHPAYMTWPLPCDSRGRLTDSAMVELKEPLSQATCIAIGPGLGRSGSSDAIVEELFDRGLLPMVLDADALNALSETKVWRRRNRSGVISPLKSPTRILTPHPGEWERLSGVAASDRAAQTAAAIEIASRTHCIVILKGHETFITDGSVSAVNRTGNAALAVGGSGDCLTGIVTALLCQGMAAIDAARLGVHLHGLAGDLAHQELGGPSVLATDVIRFLYAAFRQSKAT
jgi:NAD(P)H-hydrate epimerase